MTTKTKAKAEFDSFMLKMENDMLRVQLDQVNKMVQQAFTSYRGFADGIHVQPHYLTHQEHETLKHKGLEALYLHWTTEIRKIDEERKKNYESHEKP